MKIERNGKYLVFMHTVKFFWDETEINNKNCACSTFWRQIFFKIKAKQRLIYGNQAAYAVRQIHYLDNEK